MRWVIRREKTSGGNFLSLDWDLDLDADRPPFVFTFGCDELSRSSFSLTDDEMVAEPSRATEADRLAPRRFEPYVLVMGVFVLLA